MIYLLLVHVHAGREEQVGVRQARAEDGGPWDPSSLSEPRRCQSYSHRQAKTTTAPGVPPPPGQIL